jgi:hypothetical protein
MSWSRDDHERTGEEAQRSRTLRQLPEIGIPGQGSVSGLPREIPRSTAYSSEDQDRGWILSLRKTFGDRQTTLRAMQGDASRGGDAVGLAEY